jgi:hypothetical protein
MNWAIAPGLIHAKPCSMICRNIDRTWASTCSHVALTMPSGCRRRTRLAMIWLTSGDAAVSPTMGRWDRRLRRRLRSWRAQAMQSAQQGKGSLFCDSIALDPPLVMQVICDAIVRRHAGQINPKNARSGSPPTFDDIDVLRKKRITNS